MSKSTMNLISGILFATGCFGASFALAHLHPDIAYVCGWGGAWLGASFYFIVTGRDR